ncbi:tRNA (uracil-5-)-methyltransferase [Litorivivens lipolytica]|uniref:tRNA/tmRNA (uracil-C(5))-methyltransferase n=1 Tax=Litorivivens lipolytica TaxID=1524264 RepID=A0A7W4W3N9_9GAMM|nr:tRNA (uridine(54)-C5)-methyltransferase TrmA [Litorivivens lipolytica]MBB3046558.1 tRNA (uracil-5-)-methyltransferase [Litorivivens lipolytica]
MPLSNFKPAEYRAQLQQKVDRLKPAFAELGAATAEVFSSSETHYRMRAEFRIQHIDDEPQYVMFRKDGDRKAVVIDEFPVACKPIAELMQPLRRAIAQSDTLKRRLFQIEFLSGLSGEVLVSLIYHRPLDEDWEREARALMEQFSIGIVGRSRKQRLVLAQPYITETLNADGQAFTFRHYENSFTQPNAGVNEQMISWACKQLPKLSDDLLELYCGCGNFTLPLSRYFNKVLATEVSKTSTQAAKENCTLNDISNIEFARLSAEEISQALQGVRPFRRLAHLDLADYQLNTVFVDPPRAGLDDFSRTFVGQFKRILYISCNPETLLRDLEYLCQNHHIRSLAFFDQFPYTTHMECGVFLEEKSV